MTSLRTCSDMTVGRGNGRLEVSACRCNQGTVWGFVVIRLAAGARRLPLHHVTIRVPWHDGDWTGNVCSRPLDNTSCLILPRIGQGRRDEIEICAHYAGGNGVSRCRSISP